MAADGARGNARASHSASSELVEPGIEMSTRRPGADTAMTSHVQDPSDDVPTQPITPASKKLLEERRTRGIKAIFSLPEDAIKSWPGLQVVCAHIESCCYDVLTNHGGDSHWWRISDTLPKPEQSYEIWDWYLSFSSIHFDKSSYMNFTKFAALCYTSLILKPKLTVPGRMQFENYVSSNWVYSDDHDNEENLLQDIRNSFKIAGDFNTSAHHEDQSPDIERAEVHGDTGMIYENTVNFDSLSTIGRLKVRWVDSVANHLVFKQEKHVVCVFRFPTFSAPMIEGNQDYTSSQHWTQLALIPRPFGSDVSAKLSLLNYRLLHRELLLTYRLLFGQSPKSRNLAKDSLAKEKSTQSNSSQYVIDPLLEELCTAPVSTSWITRILSPRKQLHLTAKFFPQSCRNGQNGKFTESASYTVEHDFPVFGARLLALQEYNERQKPTRARDLWRDRRNPLQWYTFWAVIWVGSISIILGTLQLAVSIAQLYYAPGSSKNS